MSPKKAREIYSISRKVIYYWKKIKLKTGDVKRKEGYQTGHRRISKNREALGQFLEQNLNKTGAELGCAWLSSISVSSMNKTLRRFGFSYKKNHHPKRNQ
jgi:transposase